MSRPASSAAGLQRVLGFGALVAYGVGDILGAGIYALVGKVAGVAGSACWAAFAAAMVTASLTGLSYAELGGRFPRSGGAATFCQEAFGLRWVSVLIGWLVLCSGMVSMATVSHAFAGYLRHFFPAAPEFLIVLLFLSGLAVITFRGMRESSGANILCTVVELAGLLLVIGAAAWFLLRVGDLHSVPAEEQAVPAGAVLQAAALAFFAFIGFEDLVNVAEEARDPGRDLPRAIVTALAVTGTVYMVIALLAVRVVPPGELAASTAPLLAVVRRAAPAVPAGLFTAVALFAVSNTALLNFVMGSRLLYGMAREGLLPAPLGAVHPARRTPHVAIGAVLAVTLALALSGKLVNLAGTTSALLLAVFFAVNIGLVVIRRRRGRAEGFSVPSWVPAAGACASLGLMFFVPAESLGRALLLAGVGAVIASAQRDTMPGTA